jgi:hypothetical protein
MGACQPLYSSKLNFRRAPNQGRSLSRPSRQEGRGGRGTSPSHAASTCGLPHGCHGVMTSLLSLPPRRPLQGLVAGETVQRPSQSSRGGKNGPVATQACPSETGPIFDGSFPRLVATVQAHRVPARAWPMTLPSWKRVGARKRGGGRIRAGPGTVVWPNRIFGADRVREMLNVHLYFVKLFGCHIAGNNILIDITGFSDAIMHGKPQVRGAA